MLGVEKGNSAWGRFRKYWNQQPTIGWSIGFLYSHQLFVVDEEKMYFSVPTQIISKGEQPGTALFFSGLFLSLQQLRHGHTRRKDLMVYGPCDVGRWCHVVKQSWLEERQGRRSQRNHLVEIYVSPNSLHWGSQCFLRVSGLSGMLCPPSWACLLYDAVSASCLRSCFAPCPPAGKVENCLGSISWCLLVIWFMKIVWAQANGPSGKEAHARTYGGAIVRHSPAFSGLQSRCPHCGFAHCPPLPSGTYKRRSDRSVHWGRLSILYRNRNKIREEQGQQENKEEGGEIREIEGAENQSRLERAENQSRLEVKPKAPLEHLQSSQRFRQLIWSAEEAIGGLPQACSNHQGRGRIEKLTNGVAHSDMICQPEMDGHRDEGKDGILGAGSLACYSLTSAGRSMHYLCQGKNWLGQSTVKREGLAWGLSLSQHCVSGPRGWVFPCLSTLKETKATKNLWISRRWERKNPATSGLKKPLSFSDRGRMWVEIHGTRTRNFWRSLPVLRPSTCKSTVCWSTDPVAIPKNFILPTSCIARFSHLQSYGILTILEGLCVSPGWWSLCHQNGRPTPRSRYPTAFWTHGSWDTVCILPALMAWLTSGIMGPPLRCRCCLISRKGSFKRQISNEQELLVALRAETVSARALVMDQTSSLTEQLKAVAASQLLIGAHGAALFWLIVLPLCGAVFEFGTGADHHYQMLASYVGIRHRYVWPGLLPWITTHRCRCQGHHQPTQERKGSTPAV